MPSVMTNFSSEEEETIRRFLFTNPGGDISMIYPQPLVAGEELSPLMSAYSRTHIPMQQRVLRFLDRDKPEMTRAVYPHLQPIMDATRNDDGSLRMSANQAMFNRLWPLKHGHNSIKEETALFGHVELVSDITGKKITGHPLIRPQVKSTRYLSFGKTLDLSLADEDLTALPNADSVIEHIEWMNGRYLAMTDRLADLVAGHGDNRAVLAYLRTPEQVERVVEARIAEQKSVDPSYDPSTQDIAHMRERILDTELSDTEFRDSARKFVLDSTRVYLPAATKTSMGFSVDARTLEDVLTGLLSSSRIEDQRVGRELYAESKKVSPVLLGEDSHVRIDPWKVDSEGSLRMYMQDEFGDFTDGERQIDTVTLLHPRNIEMYTDRFNAALAVFPYVDTSLSTIAHELSGDQVRNVLARVHHQRSSFDVLHPAISHGGLMAELLMGYHGYRDLFRHRRGSRSTQLLTTRHGFEHSPLFAAFGLEGEYQEDMAKAAQIYEAVRAVDMHAAEKVVPFGANVRALHSWQPDQMGYVTRLRGNIGKGNFSYVQVARELAQKVGEIMPETARYFRVDDKEYPAHVIKSGYECYDTEMR